MTKIELSIESHPTTLDAYCVKYTIGTHTYSSVSTTPAADKITFSTVTFRTENSALGVKIGDNVYPIFQSNGTILSGTIDNAECPSKLVAGNTYYFLYNQNIQQNSSLFNINVNGTTLKNNSGSVINSINNLKVGSDYDAVYATKFAPTATMKEIFSTASKVTDSIRTTVFDINRTSVTGSSYMFGGWLIGTIGSVGNQYYLLEPAANESATLLEYVKLIGGTNSAYSGVTVFAVYTVKPYRINTSTQETENSSVSMSSTNGYAGKTEKVDNELNENLENATLINTGLVTSNVQIKTSVATPAYLGSVNIELSISNSEANGSVQDLTDIPYYIFDRVEIYNIGVKFTGNTASGSDGYFYHNAKIVLIWDGTNWVAEAYADMNDDTFQANNDGFETKLGTGQYGGSITSTADPYYIGSYKSGSDANNKYNKVSISNKTATTITISISYLGISGDYFNTAGTMMHQQNSSYKFKVNKDSAEGGYYG